MALYLTTGQPGHGKTAYAIDWAFQMKKEGREVYAHGIKDFDYEKAGFHFLEDPTKWQDLPDGSVVLLDECYTVFPNRNPGSKVPDHVEAMARHRHRGFDFMLVAQQGLQLDPFLRGLYELHVHVRQTSLIQSKTKLKRWTQYQNNTAASCNDVVDWIRPKYVFEYYTSTTKITTKRTVPVWLRNLAIAIGAVIVLLYAIQAYYGRKIAVAEVEHAARNAQAGAATDAAFRRQAGADPATRTWETLTDYARDHAPRFATMPWTAPVFDGRAATSDPLLMCMSSPGGTDAQGEFKGPSCTCLTEQGTAYDIGEPECRRVARFGMPYNPYRTTPAVAATVSHAPPAPLGSASSVPVVFGGGEVGTAPAPTLDPSFGTITRPSP